MKPFHLKFPLQVALLFCLFLVSSSAFVIVSNSNTRAAVFSSNDDCIVAESTQQQDARVISKLRTCRSVHHINETLWQYYGQAWPEETSANVAAMAMVQVVHMNDIDLARPAMLPSLLHTTGRAILLKDPHLSLNSIADILVALAYLSRNGNMRPLALKVVQVLEDQVEEVVVHLSPKRWIQSWQALATFDLHDSPLVDRIAQRLSKGDALSRLTPRQLVHGLRASMGAASVQTTQVAFLRRLRKQAIRNKAATSDIVQALLVLPLLVQLDDDCVAEEAQRTAWTLWKDITNREVSARECISLLGCAATLQCPNELVANLCDGADVSKATCGELTRVLSTLEQLKMTNHSTLVQDIGETVLERVVSNTHTLTPKMLNSMVRCAVLLHRTSPHTLKPYLAMTRNLLLDNKNFVASCRALELSNLVWFLAMAHGSYDKNMVVVLTDRILDVADSFTPKLASRVLSCLTTLLARRVDDDDDLDQCLFQLFHSLGGHFLLLSSSSSSSSPQLTSADVSSALYAYARASYVHDMGIFDHLVEVLSSKLETNSCTTRQIAQSLWACGKMMTWENSGEHNEPPYHGHAQELAAFLSQRTGDLSHQDVAQSIWAIGRLGILDANIVCSLAYTAKRLTKGMTCHEVANIMWGLAKCDFDDQDLAMELTRRFTNEALEPSAQEAATVLYALGIMRVYDEEQFERLSRIILGQLENASAQAIANALWAYRAVHAIPPQYLLDSWASEKLGIVRIQRRMIP